MRTFLEKLMTNITMSSAQYAHVFHELDRHKTGLFPIEESLIYY